MAKQSTLVLIAQSKDTSKIQLLILCNWTPLFCIHREISNKKLREWDRNNPECFSRASSPWGQKHPGEVEDQNSTTRLNTKKSTPFTDYPTKACERIVYRPHLIRVSQFQCLPKPATTPELVLLPKESGPSERGKVSALIRSKKKWNSWSLSYSRAVWSKMVVGKSSWGKSQDQDIRIRRLERTPRKSC